jgi:hypothetical protein
MPILIINKTVRTWTIDRARGSGESWPGSVISSTTLVLRTARILGRRDGGVCRQHNPDPAWTRKRIGSDPQHADATHPVRE